MSVPDTKFAFSEAETELYDLADAVRPTPERPIVPLGSLTKGLSLAFIEVNGLTTRTAERVLLRRGALVQPTFLAEDIPLAGFLYANAYCGAVFVAREDPIVRRRFSIAHEVGHYVLHFRPRLQDTDDETLARQGLTDAYSPPSEPADEDLFQDQDDVEDGDVVPLGPAVAHELMEREANRFAAELLMPASIVVALYEQYSRSFRTKDLIARIAMDMLVSQSAIRHRLTALRLTAGG